MTRLVVGPDRDGRWVALDAGRIAAVGDARPPATAEQLACQGCAIEPGRVNAHTHLYSGLAPFGLPAPEPAPESFLEILERFWWKLDRALDAAMLRASARLYVAEALLAGTTSLLDHHESPHLIEGSLDVLAGACEELGMRAVLCYGATERNGGPGEALRGLEECRRFVRDHRSERVRGMVGLHASFTVSDDTARAAGALCRELGTVLHVHVAEDHADVEDAKQRGFAGPLERLEALGALVPGSVLAHGVRLDSEQVVAASARGHWIVQNPRSNRGNRVGHPQHLSHALRVALGTDGHPADMLEERRVLAEEVAPHAEVMRRFEGSRRLMADRFDRPFELVPGGAGDLVTVSGTGVRDVIVDGRLVVAEGRLVFGEIEVIREQARQQAARLAAAMKA
jgi:cytosine/adenosine deaminase-related metal-dependent hydrolase